MKNIILRHMNLQDLELYFELTKPTRKYHDFNGPYYKKGTEEDLMTKIIELKKVYQMVNSMITH